MRKPHLSPPEGAQKGRRPGKAVSPRQWGPPSPCSGQGGPEWNQDGAGTVRVWQGGAQSHRRQPRANEPHPCCWLGTSARYWVWSAQIPGFG